MKTIILSAFLLSRYYNLLLLLLVVVCYTECNAQCISGDCLNGTGVYVFENKSRYEGEWKNGNQNGKGKYIYSAGDIYDGNWLEGKKHGFGKYTFLDGSYYEGSYKNGVWDGEGKFVSSDGIIQTGKFNNGKLNGIGTVVYKSGDKYAGNFINNKMEGNGTIYFANGDRFEGQFKDDKRNGPGVKFFSKGGTLKGVWVDDNFVSGSNKTFSNTSLDSSTINLVRSEQGIWETSVLINGVLKLDMIFDTGASEVYFTPDIVLTLFRTKTISDNDILQGGSYMDANGNVNKSIRFRIRELNIGGQVIKNIAAGVSISLDGLNLLGLSALEKFGVLEVDFMNGTVRTKK